MNILVLNIWSTLSTKDPVFKIQDIIFSPTYLFINSNGFAY